VDSSPAVADGTVFVGSCDNKVYALNEFTGALKWSYTTGSWVESSPAVVDGVVYVGSDDWNVYALNASTGKYIWNCQTVGQVYSSPAVADGKVYVGSWNDGGVNAYAPFYCLNASNGGFIWSYKTNSATFDGSPAIVGGVVYVGADDPDNHVYAFESNTTIMAYCVTETAYVNVGIALDGSPTGYTTPHTFTSLSTHALGTHTITVPNTDPSGHPFKNWNTGETSSTITVSYAGFTYIAYYEASSVPTPYDVTISAYCYTEGLDPAVQITMDNVVTAYTTPYTFTGLVGTHTFTVPAADPSTHEFVGWSMGAATLNITVSPSSAAQNYTVYYEGVFAPNPDIPPDNETTPPSYDVTIDAYCLTERLDPHVSITMDGVSTGFVTPHTFKGLVGNHSFAVPAQDSTGHSFMKWSTGAATITITVSPHWPPATYTAWYLGTYDVTIDAYCYSEGLDPHVSITMDGVSTGFVTPHTFTGLVGTHTFAVPAADPSTHGFIGWGQGTNANPITVAPAPPATYTAYYEGHSYDVTIDAYCYSEGLDPHVSITMDGVSTGFVTPHTFTGLVGTHTFTVPAADPKSHWFFGWSTGAATLSITVSPHWPPATYTAYYEGVYRLIIPPAKIPPYTPTPTPTPTTIPTPGKYYRWYLTRVTVTAIPSPGYVLDFWILDDVKLPPSNPFQFEFPRDLLPLEPEFQFFSFELAPEFSFSRMPGDINDDGVVDILDALLLAGAFLSTPGSPRWNPNADLNNDGIVDIFDALLLARYFGQHFP
jgi:hypothetical protein